MNEPREGDVLAGKFRIERVLGVGGMGMVVSAMHLQLDERVALKFLLPEALTNAEAVARFGREARAAVKIKSEHVARVTDVGTLENGAPYMVMELLRGQDLSQLLRDHGALPIAAAVQYVLQACEALAEAHAMGIVHRDVKPANLFLTARADGSPCIKVLDFGISKVTRPSSSGADMGMTRTQSVMGSPLYMSPEQMGSAKDVDARSDIWAIGTVLYELITGRVPFEGETMPQLCSLILHTDPQPMRSVRPEVPEQLDQVIARCLRKDRNRRYSNVAELAAELAVFSPDVGPRSAERISRVLSSSGALSLPLSSSGTATLVAGSSTGAAWGNTQIGRATRAVWFGLAGAAVVATLGVAFWKATGTHAATPVGTSAAAAPKTPGVPVSAPPAAVVSPSSSVVAASAALPLPTPPATSASAVRTSTSGGGKHAARPAAGQAQSAADGKPGSGVSSVDPLAERN